MEGFIALITFLEKHYIVLVVLVAAGYLLHWGMAFLLWQVFRGGKAGRAALHARIDTHEMECAERWGEIKKHMEIVEARLKK